MICPKCSKEMEKGTAYFLGATGDPMTMCNFTSDSEKEKGLFKRKSETEVILSGKNFEAYYCAECKLTIPLIK